MKAGVLLPEAADVTAGSFARRVEQLGYHSFWTGELWGSDSFVQLAAAATATADVRLGTSIVNVFSRTPAVLAMASASLDDLSDGRFRLGIGASTPTAITAIHGVEYDRPLRHVHEAAELVTAYLGGGDERVSYDGDLYQVAGVPPLDADVPVFNAALGPSNRRLTGRFCDGWLPHNVPFPDLDDAFETLADAARDEGRDPGAIRVAPYVPSAVSDDPGEARDAIRGHVAYYVGSGEGYRNAVATRFPDEAERIGERWASGDRDAAREAVTDEMVDALGVAGTPETARQQFAEVAAIDAVDEPIVVVPMQAADDLAERTVEALAPERE